MLRAVMNDTRELDTIFNIWQKKKNNKKQPQTYYISINFNLRDGLCALQGEIM